MEKITRKVYQNSSNGQLLVTIPKVFSVGDEIEISLSKTAYEIVTEQSYLIKNINGKKTCDFMQYQIKQLFTEDLEDWFCNGYLEETLFESWEDMSAMGVGIDFKMNACSDSVISFNLRLTKRKNYDSPNKDMIKKLKELLENKDLLHEEIKKYRQSKIDFYI